MTLCARRRDSPAARLISGRRANPDALAPRLHLNPELATKVYDTITPGTTVIVTDKPVVRKGAQIAKVLES